MASFIFLKTTNKNNAIVNAIAEIFLIKLK